MKGASIIYSAAELQWVQDNCTRPRRQMHAEFQSRFQRADVSQKNIEALCKRKGWLTSRLGQFEKGFTPHNKGLKGWCPEGSKKGWIKPGTRMGRANQNYHPIGAERITKDGYRSRKVNDDLPVQRRWRLAHLIEWEAANGPIPPGHALKCLDGNRLNCAPDNWALVPRAMLPRLAGAKRRNAVAYDHAPAELRPAILAVARLEHAAREATSRKQEARNG